MKFTKVWSALVLTMAFVLLAGCSKDPVGKIEFSQPAIYFDHEGQTITIDFVASDATSVTVRTTPKGWTAVADLAAGKLTVTSPQPGTEDAATTGMINLDVQPSKSSASTYSIYVSMEQGVDLTPLQSNSYIISKNGRYYTFPATFKGETREALPTASVGIIWTSRTSLIKYLALVGDHVSFYVPSGDTFVEGNILLGAYDTSKNLIWTWHLWFTDEVGANGIFMDRNLGALNNAHATEAEILASYGLYYQWGRRTPFVGPRYYDCANAFNASVYNTDSRTVPLVYAETDAATGTEAYAETHPMDFLTGTEASDYDWLMQHNDRLWGASKTVSDPCPHGWRVPTAAELAGLSIADPHAQENTAALMKQYGWNLTDGDVTSFFLGGGRRSALYGSISNVNTNEVPKPWIGCYWTSTPTGANQSAALYFSLDTDDASLSELNPAKSYPRANGMQIRCVRE